VRVEASGRDASTPGAGGSERRRLPRELPKATPRHYTSLFSIYSLHSALSPKPGAAEVLLMTNALFPSREHRSPAPGAAEQRGACRRARTRPLRRSQPKRLAAVDGETGSSNLPAAAPRRRHASLLRQRSEGKRMHDKTKAC